MVLKVNDVAAVSRIATRLAPSVTNGIIDQVATAFGLRRFEASNKAKKIQALLECLLSDGRTRSRAAGAIATLVMEAHHRTMAGSAQMTVGDADKIVESMRSLGLPVGDLAHNGWRDGLKEDQDIGPPASAGTYTGGGNSSVRSSPDLPHPQRHDQALRYLSDLARNGSMSPQARGLELEKIVFDVLSKERLRPERNVVNVGEQIDVTFAIRESYYLLESRWHREVQGSPSVREFSDKVRRKAEGTFGVFLSMSGFVGTINETASQGNRLNCVGLTAQELMLVLEGLRTFVEVVQAARYQASTRSLFFSPAAA